MMPRPAKLQWAPMGRSWIRSGNLSRSGIVVTSLVDQDRMEVVVRVHCTVVPTGGLGGPTGPVQVRVHRTVAGSSQTLCNCPRLRRLPAAKVVPLVTPDRAQQQGP